MDHDFLNDAVEVFSHSGGSKEMETEAFFYVLVSIAKSLESLNIALNCQVFS